MVTCCKKETKNNLYHAPRISDGTVSNASTDEQQLVQFQPALRRSQLSPKEETKTEILVEQLLRQNLFTTVLGCLITIGLRLELGPAFCKVRINK